MPRRPQLTNSGVDVKETKYKSKFTGCISMFYHPQDTSPQSVGFFKLRKFIKLNTSQEWESTRYFSYMVRNFTSF